MGAPTSTATADGQPLIDRRVLDAIMAAAPGGVSLRAIDRYAMAHDASHYLRVPPAIVTPQTAKHVSALLAAARQVGLPLTFRSGGTSLSGQAWSNHLLRRHPATSDRGLLHPGLTASACQPESAGVRPRVTDAYVSTNRTCEPGMTRSTGRPYRHVLQVLDTQTR